ncbi:MULTISPECIES: hypothetical protein [unclassified Sphingobium]|uniref:hypothetical protein n=1 Tax=unclassified Sphingobium TaxID=2611147 RepID=UPI0035A7407A
MTANRSTAVMQRRRVAPEALDYFPTPPFATRALCEFLEANVTGCLKRRSVWEPACGELHMARPLAEYFGTVRASDVHPYGGHEVTDFLFFGHGEPQTDWVITNPPFRLAEAFVDTARKVARGGVAMLLRSAWLEGEERLANLFSKTPPDYVLQFAERVVMLEGRLIRKGAADPFAEKPGTRASSATSYVWVIWLAEGGRADTRLRWIAPCFERLERVGDYPSYGVATVDGPDSDLFDGGSAQ